LLVLLRHARQQQQQQQPVARPTPADPRQTLRLAVLLHHARLLLQQPASPTSDPTPILLWGMLLQHPLRLLRLRHARLQQHLPNIDPTRSIYSATDATSSASTGPAFGLLEPAARWFEPQIMLLN